MDKFLSLVISGTVTGGIYSIMASGLVLTYTTSGIFNFAQGAIAFAVAYFYYQLNSGGMPIVPAAILSILVFAPLMGFALDRLLLRRLGEAPVYAKVVGTIGLLVAIPNFMQWVVVTIGNNILHMGWVGNKASNQGLSTPGLGPTPAKVFHVMHGVALTSDQLAVFAAALVSAVVLWAVLRHTRIGLEMRAVVDRRHLAGLKGVSASKTSAVAWVLTTVLAGLGGILISPLFSLDPIIFTLVVLGSLAAVVLGGLRSIPVAFVGGVLLGVVQNLVAGYSTAYPGFIANLNGLSSAVPYVLVILLGLVVGRDRSRQAGSVAEDRPPSDHRAGMSLPRRWWPWVTFLFLLIGYSVHWFPSWFQATTTAQTAIAQGLAISIILLSFIVVTGMGGMVSLAQATFVTAGGFAAGWALNRNWGVDVPLIASHGQLNFFWAVVIGGIVAGVIGALIAWPATRLGAVYLAIWSLAACLFFSLVPFDTQAIGNGQSGLEHPEPGRRPLRVAAQLRQPERPDPPVHRGLRTDHRGDLAVHPLRDRAGHAGRAQLADCGHGRRHPGQPEPDPRLRPGRGDRRDRRGHAQPVLLRRLQLDGPAPGRADLARLRRRLRGAATRRRPPRRSGGGLRHPAAQSDHQLAPRPHAEHPHLLALLPPDPLRPGRHLAGPGARRHPGHDGKPQADQAPGAGSGRRWAAASAPAGVQAVPVEVVAATDGAGAPGPAHGGSPPVILPCPRTPPWPSRGWWRATTTSRYSTGSGSSCTPGRSWACSEPTEPASRRSAR